MAANPITVARTRARIHEAAIRLFTTRGFHGTGIREIARQAGVSLGNLYNHHRGKEELFAAIMEELEARYTAPGTPLDRAFEDFATSADLEALGAASGEMVEQFSNYIRLIYVDVVELSGSHIKKLFGGMRARYEQRFNPRLAELTGGDLSDEDPISALMLTTIAFFFYFNIRKIFAVDHFFAASDQLAIARISAILRKGIQSQ